MEGEAQEAAFVFAAGLGVAGFDVEKLLRVAAVRTFLDDENFSGLINDEEASAAVRRFGHPDGTFVLQFGQHGLEDDWRQCLRGDGERKAEQDGGQKVFHVGEDVMKSRAVSTDYFTR